MKMTLLKKIIRKIYIPHAASTSFESQIIASFFIDFFDRKFLENVIKDDEQDGLTANSIAFDKRENQIIFYDIFDEGPDRFEFIITQEVFLKIINEWDIAKNSGKEYIIIEVSDDKKDVSIYAVDSIDN